MTAGQRAWLSIFLLSIFLAAGCARVDMTVNAYRSGGLAFPESDAGRTIGVVVETTPDEPLLNEEIGRKAASILEAKGYTVAPPDKADYLLVCAAGMDAGVRDTDYQEVTGPGRYARSYYTDRHGHTRTVTTYLPGRTTYLPYTYTVYTKGLVLTLLKKDLLSGPEKDEDGRDRAEATVWRCVTRSGGSSGDLRWIVNPMLLAAFDRFGKDTRQEEYVSMPPDSERIRHLAEEDRYETPD